ncbi:MULTISPECIES: amino acid ABC transporter ATP-binding protein [unclassified Streptococcus]|uniref:amino acid ABC transporter ATP-binding protein n=1 Tax=unclassified Streptococcus TaxID=2608887 RepID=UPI0011B84680|nr:MULTISPECIES: amino acid ABC transporter ATP-binding protein [unclassified Streptococcus]TWS95297.1 amino acid ABC transporter ATP-binding protein [Streptococcus sp. sy018]TWT12028.1 amino acid ABC transporter ATP-binding protein [Streptococcus sp. sy004]TWT16406.1 amino acid ABC transporter ATP-binding protein [Streptococcus sp. sy010]
MLVLKQIAKRFGSKQIFENFDLTIEKGKTLAIVGQSGGGKTTLLRMLAGLESIDSGQIFHNGKEVGRDYFTKNQLLGFVFQDFQLFPHLTVLDNLILSPVKTQGMSRAAAETKALELLERLGLSNQVKNYPHALSGGQKQRVALARAMMIDPEIIGYDEPTSALDPELRREVEQLILQNKQTGITQLIITHDLDFAQHIADDIVKVYPK